MPELKSAESTVERASLFRRFVLTIMLELTRRLTSAPHADQTTAPTGSEFSIIYSSSSAPRNVLVYFGPRVPAKKYSALNLAEAPLGRKL